ncbi:MAG TPA: peptidase M48, partial [Verrucomicrobiae bacterium]|nr:peptidase M48 [Verrucomicrobiae bacterium]
MRTASGWWYDGKTSARRKVVVACGDDRVLRITGEGVVAELPLAEVRVDESLGTARRMLRFPDGAALETNDHHFLDGLLRLQGKGGFFRGVHRWESSLKLAFCALVLTLAAGFGFLRYAVPFMAARVALAL